MQFVQYLAGQGAVAIENCNLFEESQHLVAYTASVIESMTGGFISTDKVESSHGATPRRAGFWGWWKAMFEKNLFCRRCRNIRR